MTVKQLSVNDLQKKIARNENIFLLDVREPNEFQYAHIANSTLIPLNQIPNRLTELDFKQEIMSSVIMACVANKQPTTLSNQALKMCPI